MRAVAKLSKYSVVLPFSTTCAHPSATSHEISLKFVLIYDIIIVCIHYNA